MASWGLWGWFVLAGSLSFRQSADQALHQIEAALRQGDARALAAYFAPQVEIFLNEGPRIYSSTQGQYVMKEFFEKNPPTTFTLFHKGRSEDMLYAIGSYVSPEGKWDVSFFTRFQGGRYWIYQLRFEPVE